MNDSIKATADLRLGLKKMILRECNVRNVNAEDLSDEAHLIGATEGLLRLDSLDAVEIVAAIERNFSVRIDNAGEARHVLKSIVTVSDFVAAHATQPSIEKFLSRQGG
jgi:acyl carrier protein